jgi:hypothetical protein
MRSRKRGCGKIVRIDVVGDPARLRELEIAVLTD